MPLAIHARILPVRDAIREILPLLVLCDVICGLSYAMYQRWMEPFNWTQAYAGALNFMRQLGIYGPSRALHACSNCYSNTMFSSVLSSEAPVRPKFTVEALDGSETRSYFILSGLIVCTYVSNTAYYPIYSLSSFPPSCDFSRIRWYTLSLPFQ